MHTDVEIEAEYRFDDLGGRTRVTHRGAETIQTIHGDRREHRGLTRFRVQSVLLLSVLGYNPLRAPVIAPAVMLPSTA